MHPHESTEPATADFLAQLSRPWNVVVIQPTTLCNANCTYCYLPGRDRRDLMSVDVAKAIARGIADQDAPWAVRVLWHAGEPLTVGHEHFELLLAPFEELRRAGKVSHATQTNATLVDAAWCDLFARYEVGVGVSIDGPQALNLHRVDWQGREIFDRSMRGMSQLRAAGIRFNVVAVVSPQTITRASDLLEFLDGLGVDQVHVNFEERQNANDQRPLVSRDEAERFWRDALVYLRGDTNLRIRQLGTLSEFLAGETLLGGRQPVPSVTSTGDVVLAAAELIGAIAPRYGNFVVDNVLRTSLRDIVASAGTVPYVQDYARGLANCRASCSFWDYCGGLNDGGNRWAEHHDLAATETAFCRTVIQAPVAALRSVIASQPMTDATVAVATVLADLASDPG
jgi:uncharacterized protein